MLVARPHQGLPLAAIKVLPVSMSADSVETYEGIICLKRNTGSHRLVE